MPDYSQIETAVQTTFNADLWLGNAANVKLIKTGKRGYSIDKNAVNLFARPEEMPGLFITANVTPKQTDHETVGEFSHRVFCEVQAVSRGKGFDLSRAAHQVVVENMERVLDRQVTSSNDLGINALVSAVASRDDDTAMDGDYFIFVSTTSFAVEIIENF